MSELILNPSLERLGLKNLLGIRAALVRGLQTDLSMTWSDAVSRVGPDTLESCEVWNVSDRYELEESGVVRENVLLISPIQDFNLERALDWAYRNGLVKSCPLRVFSFASQYPDFDLEIGMRDNYLIRLVETTSCQHKSKRHVCAAVFREYIIHADLLDADEIGVPNVWSNSQIWFAFRMPKTS